jgi:MFS transporter, SP family, general alpha glucoside:H+ symporter
MAQKDQGEIQAVELQEQRDEPAQDVIGPLMRSKEDSFGIWRTVLRHKRVGFIAMTAAFCASLDGYRMLHCICLLCHIAWLTKYPEINLNGNIVANKGFIRQMASPGTAIIAGKYVSAWGGIQSTGQAVGQILLQYVTEGYGRKPALLVIWAILTAVCC